MVHADDHQTRSKVSGQYRFEMDMCRFGSKHMKPTAIVGTFKLNSLALKCDKDRRPHVHDPLTGTVTVDGIKKFKTRLP